jgi:REP element-mobilizing transposase RayT
MPNHVHGLLVLSNRDNHAASASEGRDEKPADRIARMAVISARGNSLPVVVRIFKATVTGACRRAGCTQFAWQSGYYEHVVRNERELGLVRAYIRNNPAKWALDHDHPDYRGPQPSTTPWIDE